MCETVRKQVPKTDKINIQDHYEYRQNNNNNKWDLENIWLSFHQVLNYPFEIHEVLHHFRQIWICTNWQ